MLVDCGIDLSWPSRGDLVHAVEFSAIHETIFFDVHARGFGETNHDVSLRGRGDAPDFGFGEPSVIILWWEADHWF
jgi:hypothetical protein